MRGLLVSALLHAAASQLNQAVWPSVAFGPLDATTASLVPAINITQANNGSLPQWVSVRYTGTVTWAANATVNFTALTEGGVRLWVDDHLVIDDGGAHTTEPRLTGPFLPIPFVGGAPQPIRLEYSHWNTSAATLQLLWRDASGPPDAPLALVPPTRFTPGVSPGEAQRQALRDRLVNPPVPWQTYHNPSMAAHMHMPSGLIVSATLANADTSEVLGGIYVYRQFNPAAVSLGLHSPNGSDYSEFTVSAWHWRDCNVTFQTVVEGSGRGAQLQFLATPAGSACGPLVVLIYPETAWERLSSCSSDSSAGFTCAAPGFDPVTVTPIGQASPVPFPAANLSMYVALPLVPSPGGTPSPVGYVAGGAAVPVGNVQANLAAARAALHEAAEATYGRELARVYEAVHSTILWTTMFTPIDGVVTPVGRTWDFGSGYALFCWDNLFLAWMAALEPGRARDIAYSNLIQTIRGRTPQGFVANWRSGSHVSFDRSEPQIGAQTLLRIFNHTGDAWLVELLLDTLIGWADWVWEYRRGEGSLTGPDGHADLVVLGSDVNNPPGDGTSNTLQGARFESGLDNSPLYDAPPVAFNASTGHMSLYDVGMTGLLHAELVSLVALAQAIGRHHLAAGLQARADAVHAAMGAHLWSGDSGLYENVLFNGSALRRYAPTSLFPLLGGAASDAQASSSVAFLTSPLGLCVNTSHSPHPNASLLLQWANHGYNHRPDDNAACVSYACSAWAVRQWHDWGRVEASVLGADGADDAAGASRRNRGDDESVAGGAPPLALPSSSDLVPLYLFFSEAHYDSALVASLTPPDGTYAFVRQEGWCFPSASAAMAASAGGAWAATPLTLYLLANATFHDYLTCGSSACRVGAAAAGYAPVGPASGTLCFGWDASSAATAPCRVGGTSIARADPAFADQAYWRGRAWGPHIALLYWALQAYDHLPEARGARAQLVAQGLALLLRSWDAFGFVSEHYNGQAGVYDWTYQLDPSYTWGALPGFIALVEAGFYDRG